MYIYEVKLNLCVLFNFFNNYKKLLFTLSTGSSNVFSFPFSIHINEFNFRRVPIVPIYKLIFVPSTPQYFVSKCELTFYCSAYIDLLEKIN